MEYKEGRLGYNRKNDRYGLLVTDLWEIDGFSCGNRLQVEINGEWVDTHMEMDWSTGKGVWYLTETDFKGSELENKRVRVLRDKCKKVFFNLNITFLCTLLGGTLWRI